jgi:hypothetical protein
MIFIRLPGFVLFLIQSVIHSFRRGVLDRFQFFDGSAIASSILLKQARPALNTGVWLNTGV